MSGHSIGVDIGGTFTDIVLLGPNGYLQTHKVSSTPDDFSRGILTGVTELLASANVGPEAVGELVHATTVAANTILEQKGSTTALITTAGFRDVLEMRRLRIPVLYDIQYDKPPPLAPRRLRFEVTERMGPRGEVRIPLDEASVEIAAKRVKDSGVEAVAICLLHSYANPDHEQRVAAIVRRIVGDDIYITCSSDILPEIREYERTSTAVVNSYVGPVVRRYLQSLGAKLSQANLKSSVRIMQSSGGVMTAQSASDKPAYIVESGPAAGVIACARLARQLGHENIISFDMGGTTAKAAIIENGEPAKTTEYEVGAGINLSSKLVKGGGYAIKLPFIDVSEIGAGGGSIVSIDRAGALKVGPQSAGAMPGPICYDLGGTEPTFTDAMVVLGYVNPDYLVGGKVKLNAAKSRRVLEERIAKPLKLSLLDAAHGIFTIASATMTRAVKAVSTYRGRDPRDFALIAFGGNGPVAGVEVARSLKMKRVLVPPAPGVFSAVGLLLSDIEHEFLRTFFRRTEDLTEKDIAAAFKQLEAEALATLKRESFAMDQVDLRWYADLRYSGQAYELTIPVTRNKVSLDAMHDAFHAEHERTYGHRSDGDPVDLVNVKILARVPQSQSGYKGVATDPSMAAGLPARKAYFGAGHGTSETPIYRRGDLAGRTIDGPAIVEEYDATVVIPPGCRASLDKLGNIDIEFGMIVMAATVDPITFEVVKNALSSIADEMALIIMRSAYSPVVRDSMDYSTALADRHGQIIAQGLTLAVQLGAFPDGMRYILQQETPTAKPGDIFIFNDPYGSGGQHLPDIYVIKPIFFEGKIEGYACTMAHHSDVGGIAPGSTAIHAIDIRQEGLCIPLMKLYDEGKPNKTLFKIIEKNTRQPIQVMGDLKAQLAACTTGEKGYLDLLRRHGADGLHPYLDALQDQAEAMMRAFIRDIPDGEYDFVDYIDGIGEDPQTLRIQCKVIVKGDDIVIDLSGTSKQVAASINCPIALINSSSYCAIRCVTSPDIPNCEGYIRPIKVIAPPGTIVNSLSPAACGARGVMGYRTYDAVMGALAKALPDRVIAPGEGGPTLFSIGGWDKGRQFVLTEVMVGTWGARAGKDGVEGISNPAANLSNQPIELIEAELPLEVVSYGLSPDSGGAGKYRGGLAYVREFRSLTDDAICTTRADRRDHPPYGLYGGSPGGGSRNVLNPGPGETVLPTMPMRTFTLNTGDVFRHVSAGGGGYGDPLERSPQAVLEDVIDEKVSVEAARSQYGVVIKQLKLDEAETATLRQSMKKPQAKPAKAPQMAK